MKILFVFGTRPEAIKVAPVIAAMHDEPGMDVRTCVTAQHREMLDQALAIFHVTPDIDLDLMRPDQDLASLTSQLVSAVYRVIAGIKPDWLIVQGDTTTTFTAALAAFYARVPVAHIEAGLRSGSLEAPWPEELNRKLTSSIAALHFAPTDGARDNLLREGISSGSVIVTGNTVIDAVARIANTIRTDAALRDRLDRQVAFLDARRPLILTTGHRRESFGPGLESICRALLRLAREEDVEIVYPVHLNPNVQEPVRRILGASDRIHLIDPVDYVSFVHLMMRSRVILTDSGGVQEEAPFLAKPVLVMRETTERPEAVSAGVARLVGTSEDAIVAETKRLLHDAAHYASMSSGASPYGDGTAARQIVDVFRRLPAV
ncbi:MAG: non-hydrolyzing UDP-N-acetylglucosamine 2-epimerase [Thermoanaerobaculia bacterium]